MSEQGPLEQRLESLESRLAALETENADLRAQLAECVGARPRTTRRNVARLSRRKALASLGSVAASAGIAATAVSLANAPAAHAADGGTVLLGQTNTASHETIVTDDGTVTNAATFGAVATTSATGVLGASASGAELMGTGGQYDLVLNGSGRTYVASNSGYDGPTIFGQPVGMVEVDTLGRPWFHTSVADYGAARPGFVQCYVPESFGGARIQGGALNFLPSPVRMIGAGNPPGISLAAGSHTNFTLAGSAGIPASATAVFGNVTVYNAGGSGFVTLTPQGGSISTSSLNFTGSDQPLSNFVAVALSFGSQTSGAITVFVSNNFAVKFIFDVVGFCL